MEEDTSGEEGEISTWCWCSYDGEFGFETIDALGITELENNHIGNPIVNPGKLNVAIRGGTTFPNEGIKKGSPWEGVSWLVVTEGIAIAMEQNYLSL